jgi:hypothetical protein
MYYTMKKLLFETKHEELILSNLTKIMSFSLELLLCSSQYSRQILVVT